MDTDEYLSYPLLLFFLFDFVQKWRFHHDKESYIGTYTFLLSCAVSSNYPDIVIGIYFLLSKTSTIGNIFFLGTQIFFFCPFVLDLNALDTPILGRSLHLDIMHPTLPQK